MLSEFEFAQTRIAYSFIASEDFQYAVIHTSDHLGVATNPQSRGVVLVDIEVLSQVTSTHRLLFHLLPVLFVALLYHRMLRSIRADVLRFW